MFAWQVCKFVKSNAHRVRARRCHGRHRRRTDEPRRVSCRIAGMKASDEGLDPTGSVMASDAFFPFRDGLDAATAGHQGRDSARRLEARRRSHRGGRRARHRDGVHRHAPLPALSMRVLIVGGGGREHALAWKVAQSPRVTQVFVAPGNAGTALEPRVAQCRRSRPTTCRDCSRFAREERIDLTIVGPEGAAGRRRRRRLRSRRAALLRAAPRPRGSKAPRPSPRTSSSATGSRPRRTRPSRARRSTRTGCARSARRSSSRPTASPPARAWSSANPPRKRSRPRRRCSPGSSAPPATRSSSRNSSKARKRASSSWSTAATSCRSRPRRITSGSRDGDRGPNTGGMGAYSPAPVVTPAIHERIMREVMQPTVRGLAADGTPYVGFLYAGLMIAADGTPNVLEFNCRFGDPETQPILMRLRSDLTELVRGGARRPARRRRRRLGPARGARRGAGRGRLSGHRAQGRRDPRAGRGGAAAGQGLPRRHGAPWRRGGRERRTRAVRGRPRRRPCARRSRRPMRS